MEMVIFPHTLLSFQISCLFGKNTRNKLIKKKRKRKYKKYSLKPVFRMRPQLVVNVWIAEFYTVC